MLIRVDMMKQYKPYDKSIELDPQNPRAWNSKGYVLEELGRHDEAQACFDKAKELGYTG